jgi:hypothetical protein
MICLLSKKEGNPTKMSYSDYKNEESVDEYGSKYEWNFLFDDSSPVPIIRLKGYVLTEIQNTRRMVLLHLEEVTKENISNRHFLRITVVENPGMLLKNSILHHDKAFPFQRCPFYVERKASNKCPQKIFMIKASQQGEMVESLSLGEIPVLQLHKVLDMKNYAMPPEFYKVVKGFDPKCKYHINVGEHYEFFKLAPVIQVKEVIKEVVKEVVKKQIPKHIFDIVVQQAVEKKDDCPVMMIPFTKQTASCGPCGHLVSYDALLRCVQDKKECPVCREKMGVVDIQKGF